MDFIDFHWNFLNHCQSETKDGLLTKILTTFREYLRNVLDKFHKFGKSHPNWQKPMYYSTWISLIFIEIFKITANLKRKMGFWRNYSQLFGSTLGTFWTSFKNSENRTQIDKNPCTIVHGFHWFSSKFLKSLPIWNETWASDETTHNFSGVP